MFSFNINFLKSYLKNVCYTFPDCARGQVVKKKSQRLGVLQKLKKQTTSVSTEGNQFMASLQLVLSSQNENKHLEEIASGIYKLCFCGTETKLIDDHDALLEIKSMRPN